MAVVTRPTKARRNGRPVLSYQVRWRFRGVGDWQSRTLDSKTDAQRLNTALKALGWEMLDDDPAVVDLTLIGAPARPKEPTGSALADGTTLFDAFTKWSERPGLAHNSRTAYITARNLLGESGRVTISAFDADEANRLFRRVEKTSAPTVVKNLYGNVVSVLRQYDCADKVAHLRGAFRGDTRLQAIYLSETQVERLLVAADQQPKGSTSKDSLALFILFVVTTGLRLGEALALQRRHFDVDKGIVYVRQALQANATTRADGFKPGPVKTPRANRMVPMFAPLDKIMAEHVQDMEDDREVVFKPVYADWWIPNTIEDKFRRLCERTAGVPSDLRIHDLRHTAAKNMIEGGVKMRTASRILGHSSMEITDRVYGGFDSESLDLARLVMAR